MADQSKIWDKLYRAKLVWHYESKLPEVLRDKKVLELGVGTGKTLKGILRQKPSELICIDFSSESIDLLKRYETSRIKFIKSNITSMPLKDHTFDAVICYYILNNLNRSDRIRAAKEIKRVLKPNGILLFEDFAEGDLRQKGEVIEKNTVQKKSGLICHFFNEKEIRSLFKSFKNVRLKITSTRPFRILKDERRIISAILNKS